MSDPDIVPVIFLGVVMAGTVALALLVSGLHSRLDSVARRVGGQAVYGRSAVGGHVIWHRGTTPFYYYERGRGADCWSVISIGPLAQRLPAFQLRSRHLEPPIPAPPHESPLPADLALEAQFRCVHTSPGPPPGLLTDSLLQAWNALLVAVHPRLPTLEVLTDRARVWIPGVETRRRTLAAIEPACAVLELLLGGEDEAPQGAIQVTDVLLQAAGPEAVCQVCGEPVGSGPVRCGKCATPHHRDCWDCTGCCSVFGCGCRDWRYHSE